MPTYDYGCKACGHEFEKEQRISDKPVKKCPECGKLQAKRLISRTSFVLKGGGWYNDLYASSDKPGADKKDAADSGADAKGESDSKGEAAAKTESTSKGEATSSSSETKSGKARTGKGKKSGSGKKDAA